MLVSIIRLASQHGPQIDGSLEVFRVTGVIGEQDGVCDHQTLTLSLRKVMRAIGATQLNRTKHLSKE